MSTQRRSTPATVLDESNIHEIVDVLVSSTSSPNARAHHLPHAEDQSTPACQSVMPTRGTEFDDRPVESLPPAFRSLCSICTALARGEEHQMLPPVGDRDPIDEQIALTGEVRER